MPANRFNGHTSHGIGIGLRVPHYAHILEQRPVVGWFEIISENFMVDGGRPLEILDRILEQYHVVQHGVSMYFGSADKPDRAHLKKLKQLVRRTRTPWVSDHLCWGSVDGTYTHDLLPMPYTFAAARRTAEKIRQVRDFLGVPICVENVSSYAEFHVSEMTEWEFLTEVVERADCGILLDVNNIYVSSQNHGFDPYDYLNGIPADSRAATDFYSGNNVRKRVESGELLGKLRKLNDIAAARGQSLAQMALAWILRLPEITSALIGASKVSQIEDNVAALSNLEFSAEELQSIEDLLK